jgi:DNA-binding NarL/FixJ family response regulator
MKFHWRGLPLDLLTPAQRPVLKLLLDGLSEREVAEHLGLSPHTVHNHARAIYRKLCIHKKSELFRHLLPRMDQTVILRREDIDAR